MKKKQLELILESLNQGNSVDFNAQNQTFLLHVNPSLEDSLRNEFDGAIDKSGDRIEFDLNRYQIYFGINMFKKDFELTVTGNFAIIDYVGSQYIGNIYSLPTLMDEYSKETPFFIYFNHIYYLRIQELLCSPSYGFADYADTVKRKIIFRSSDKGTLSIGYPLEAPIHDQLNLASIFVSMERVFNTMGLFQIFKGVVFSHLEESKEEDRLQLLIDDYDLLYEKAIQDYEIYLKNFSFDKLLSDFRIAKNKYFQHTKEIISRTIVQVASIPVAISAASLASYKINAPWVLLIIWLTFTLYTCFLIRVYYVLWDELESICTDFRSDSKLIYEKSGIKPNIVDIELSFIEKRLNSAGSIIRFFVLIIVLSYILFTIFIYFQSLQNSSLPFNYYQVKSNFSLSALTSLQRYSLFDCCV